jgi:pentatricopeptide repeat protein
MLRTKQLGFYTQSARFFLFSGSRCNASEESCTCSEDETCIARKQNIRNELRQLQTKTTIIPKTSAVRSASLIAADAGIPVHSAKVDGIKHPAALPISRVVSRPDSLTYADVDVAEGDTIHPSPHISDQFVKAGIAAVTFLSDISKYKIPTSDESETQNCVVDRTRPLANIKPSTIKTFRKEKPQQKPVVETSSGTNSTTTSHDKKARSTNNVHNSFVHQDSRDQRYIPNRAKVYSTNRNMPSVQKSEGKVVSEIAEGFNRPARVHAGFAPAGRHFGNSSQVVDCVSNILQQLNWGPATETALHKLNCSMDPYQANQVLKELKDYSVALSFFYWLKRQPGFKHDGHTYTTMVGILGRAKQFGVINKLLDQMISEGCKPNVVTYNRLIHSYGRANYLKEAVNVFNQMQEANCKPDRVTYCTLIDIHAKSGYLNVAMDMYQRMQEAGLTPDTFTFSVIINCLGKAGHLAAAHKLFCEMVNQGCVPNLVTYNIMIALQAKARNYPTALQLYRDMQNAGFQPDKVTYSIVMEVLGHCGYLEEAEAIFSEMKRKNWVPDEPVYGLLVDLWGKAGDVQKAWQWYRAMLDAGLCPNVPTCNSMLSAFLRVHKLPDAYNLLQNMLSLGLNPSLQTYTLLLSCCTEAQTPFDMSFCCELMSVTNHPAHRFLQSMPAAGPDGQNVRDHVSTFLDLMHSEDRESKRGLVDAVVDFLHKSGLKEEAGSVWEVAASKNVYPDAVREKSTCYWLINLHVMSDGTAVTALSRTLAWFRKQMLVSGICPSRIDIVTGWGRRSRVTGSSLVRQAVQELLNIFSFPFFTENGNSGCFVGCGEPLNKWLLQSYVDRMHLL